MTPTHREEVKAVLAKHDFKLTEAASASLLETSENKQVQVLLHAFDKEFEEWEIRDLLSDHGTLSLSLSLSLVRVCVCGVCVPVSYPSERPDWDGAAVTVKLNAKLGERKQKREEEQQKAEKERVVKALEAEQKQRSQATLVASKSDAQKQQEMEERKLQSAKRVTLRRVKKTENLGNHFEKQMREREEAQAQQQQQNTAQQQQKFEGARQQLVKNLQVHAHTQR
jgi:flagellar biosynthesis GTPase FlhF